MNSIRARKMTANDNRPCGSLSIPFTRLEIPIHLTRTTGIPTKEECIKQIASDIATTADVHLFEIRSHPTIDSYIWSVISISHMGCHLVIRKQGDQQPR